MEFGDGDPYLFIYHAKDGNNIYYVFFKRLINSLEFIENNDYEKWYDIITPPYGYGGPLYEKTNEKTIEGFRKDFETYCQDENIVTEFVRFHPLYKNAKYLDKCMDVFYDRETIYIDLLKTEEEIFNNYHNNHKRNVRRGSNNGLEFRVLKRDEALLEVHTFYLLYKETMDKLGALSYSYFSESYIRNLLSDLDNNSVIGAVFFEGKMVAAAICLYESGCLHYHLGCSKQEFLHLGINIFLFHHLALWAKKLGFQKFHLGGGHVGRDSLFQFKQRFNKEGVLKFYIGKKIHNESIYKSLLNQWERYYSQKVDGHYFPLYRKAYSN
ncbi:GNAT family N-acetyltransferase [Bacillus sp. 31A1R]|uniref:Lipid II:glycine glycyltransferase n=1 Tax=Robertmurraya mangrovi TaxID=3098077 RepID=A0ABU5ITF1_9BACI|nr:GNAT family N-acetyltransferase [Bacillus sp. 31A1R]MDZ5470434.1 GNAT family N-acetyltransferase [Bacillus sp. 31A1R]